MKNNVSVYITLHVVVVAIFLSLERFFVDKPLETTWKVDHFGSLRQFQPTSGTTGTGITEKSEFVTIDLPTHKFVSLIDLTKTDSDSYHSLDSFVVTYSGQSSNIYVFEKSSGKFIDKVALAAPPEHFGQFYDNGLLILDSNGLLTAWNGNILKTIGKYDVKTFQSNVFDDLLYVSLGSSIICLNEQAENIIANVGLSSDILVLNHGLAVSKNEILNLKSNVKTSVKLANGDAFHFTRAEVFSNDIIADFEAERVTLFKVKEGEGLEMSTQHAAPHSNGFQTISSGDNTFIVAYSENGMDVTDFTLFLKTEKLEDIKSFEKSHYSHDGEISFFLSREHDEIYQVVVNEHEVTVVSHSLNSDDVKSVSHPLTESIPRSKSALIDMPRPISEIEKTHYLAEESHMKSPVLRLILKFKHHLSQFSKFYVKLLTGKSVGAATKEDTYGFQKLLVTFDHLTKELVARNSQSSEILWKTKIDNVDELLSIESLNDVLFLLSKRKVIKISARDGHVENIEELQVQAEKFIRLAVELPTEVEEEGIEPFALVVKSGTKLYPLDNHKPLPDQYFADGQSNKLRAFKIVNNALISTWEFAPKNEEIVTWTKNEDKLSPSAGIAKAGRSVLYKYLNPNLITVITKNSDSSIQIYLLDGITGAVLHIHRHSETTIDVSSINVVQHDNWVLYSYIVNDELLEQRVSVLDLFGTKGNAKGGERSAFSDYDLTIHNVSSKTFIFPERIVSLVSTSTKHGITVRSIIALTEMGSLVEIPKYLFNSRRIEDRALTPADVEEFKMMPYEPVVPKPDLQVLNGNQRIDVSGKKGSLLVQPTEMESSCVVCYANEAAEFCTVVQPSLSYDILKTGFDKHKLLLTLGLLYTAYISTKPFVKSKKLNTKWLD